MPDDFELTPYEAKVLPEGERLTSFKQLVGHTIKHVCKAPKGPVGQRLGAIFITETLCWLPVQAHDNGFDSEPSLSVYTFSQELLLSDLMTAYELHSAGLLTDAQWEHMQVQERGRKAEENRRKAAYLRDQCAAAGVPFLFKQWGAWSPRALICGAGHDFQTIDPQCKRWPDVIRLGEHGRDTRIIENCTPDSGQEVYVQRVGKKAAGLVLDGVLHDGYPELSA